MLGGGPSGPRSPRLEAESRDLRVVPEGVRVRSGTERKTYMVRLLSIVVPAELQTEEFWVIRE